MKIDILSIFPEMLTGPLHESILKRAQAKGLVEIAVHDLRQWTSDSHRTTDDRPYGGGPGMVMMVEPIDRALHDLKARDDEMTRRRVILTAAGGATFNQSKATEYTALDHLIIICGHYEGVDQRVADYLVDESVSIGNYVLTGGELPALVITDAVTRLIPGVVGDPESIVDESHKSEGYVEYPHYTRPESYKGWNVPEVLLSGNHAAIAKWRQEKSQS